MATVESVLQHLQGLARPDQLEGMARYGMAPDNRLGVAIPELRKLARQLGKSHELALQLWATGVADARILAAMVDDPRQLTPAQMDDWVKDLNSWDVCDQVCMNLFDRSPLAWSKIEEWSRRQETFVKRAAFALIACLAWHHKAAPDEQFVALWPIIESGAADNRNYVRKAVSWAIRHIGKRNRQLHAVALRWAEALGRADGPAARWIAADVRKDLGSEAVQRKLTKGGN